MEFRKLNPTDLNDDNLRLISTLIYETDPYIYPAMFSTKEDALIVLPAVIKQNEDAMFSWESLYAAWEGGKPIAIILWHKGALSWKGNRFKEVARANAIRLPDTFDLVCKNYFAEYDDASLEKVVSLINVCVTECCCGKGIATQMLEAFFCEMGENYYELHCLEKNIRAVTLYQKMGFETVSWQRAFTVLDEKVYSVKMIRRDV